jgi:hypothetical protein
VKNDWIIYGNYLTIQTIYFFTKHWLIV